MATNRSLGLVMVVSLGVMVASCPPKHVADGLMDPILRRAILGRVWETVDEHYLYQDFGGLDWHEELARYRTEVGLAADNAGFYATVDEMIFALGDDHSIYLAPWEACDEDRYYETPPAANGDGVAVVPAPKGWRLDGRADIAYLQLPSFDSLAVPGLVDQLLADTLEQGPVTGLVLDLRQNYGGCLDAAYEVLENFVEGEVGSEYDDLGIYPISLNAGQHFKSLATLPMVVLVDEGTNSAAEIVAAVLQPRGRAIVVGRTTPGNTEAVVNFDFVDGSRLWLAVGEFRLPNGSSLEETGVEPDLVVETWGSGSDPFLDAAVAALVPR